jgi:hypothetical protein
MFRLPHRLEERNHRLRSSVARNIKKTRKRPLSAAATFRAELTGDDICSVLGVTVQTSSPILALCRKLIEVDRDPSTSLEVYRKNILCVRITSIGQAAQLEPSPTGVGFVRRHSRLRAAPSTPTAPANASGAPKPFASTIARARALPPCSRALHWR